MIRLTWATIAMCCLGALIARGYTESPAIAGVVLSSVVAIAVISPGAALGAAILALPTAYTPYPLPVGSFSLLELAILGVVAGLALRLVMSGLSTWRTAWHAGSDEIAITLPTAAIIPAAVLAYVMLPDGAYPDVTAREIRIVLVEPLLLFGAALIVLRDRRARTWAWVCVAVIGTVIGAGASVQVIGGFGGVESGALTRATGIYSHPNNLALFLERTFLISLPMLLFRPRDSLLWLAVGAQGVGLVLTFSRGAMLAVTVGVGVALLMLGIRRWLKAAAALAIVAGAMLFAISRDRLLDAGGSGSESTRLAIWRSSVWMLVDHPVFGVGPDQFLYQYGRRYIEPSAWPERYSSHPHNIVLDVWLRLGAAGLGVFAALVVGVWRFARRMGERIRTDAISCGAVAALAGGAAHGLLDNGFFLPDLAAATWVAIAMLLTVEDHGTAMPLIETDPGER